MGDWIDDLVDAQLKRGQKVDDWIGQCPYCCMAWHGIKYGGACPGSHVRYSKEIVRHADFIAWQAEFGM